ncbi:MAG: prepilin-type N-terminal cleavage/methylation domain-containing protein [Acidimicrobiales bacterium]
MRSTSQPTSDDRGFTLVELVVAIVVVGILSAVVVVGVGALASRGGSAGCQASADAARIAAQTHWTTTGSQPATFAELIGSGSLTPPAGATVTGRTMSTAGWTLRLVLGTGGNPPTFSCSVVGVDADVARYWVGTTSTSWSNPANWSTSSGGAGGAGVPTATDAVVLDGGGVRDLVVDPAANTTVRSWTQTAAYMGTVTFSTVYSGSFTTFSIADSARIDGGAWTHTANASTQVSRLAVDVGGDLVVGAAGRIDVVGKGYAEGRGPGGSTIAYQGASYGGNGVGSGTNGLGASPPTYGSFVQPTDLGSGGGPLRAGTSRGGGAIRLTVAGSTRIDGTVTAVGACATEYAGCASGGSVWLSTGTLTGSGTITADGGTTTWTAPGGGGGRVAVDLAAGTDVGSVTLRARGGPSQPRSGIGFAGGAGTVYLERAGEADGAGQLIVDNGDQLGAAPTRTPVPAGATWVVRQLVVRGGGIVSVEGGATLDLRQATITASSTTRRSGIRAAGGTLQLPATTTITDWWLFVDAPIAATGNWTLSTGGGITQTATTSVSTVRGTLDLTGDLTVAAGGTVDVSSTGYPAFTGPGSQIGNNARYVGSHGGLASPNGVTYGDPVAPIEPGSGSHAYSGGGAITLRVTGRLQVDGTIRANGGGCGWNCGGGAAGGSIWIVAGTIGGAGSITADGGNDGWHGGGGGGRVSITVTSSGATVDPRLTITAYGGNGPGSGAAGRVGAGSVYLRTPADTGVLSTTGTR